MNAILHFANAMFLMCGASLLGLSILTAPGSELMADIITAEAPVPCDNTCEAGSIADLPVPCEKTTGNCSVLPSAPKGTLCTRCVPKGKKNNQNQLVGCRVECGEVKENSTE